MKGIMKKRNIAVDNLGARVKIFFFLEARNIVLLTGKRTMIIAGSGWPW